jgi:hypothetical protein
VPRLDSRAARLVPPIGLPADARRLFFDVTSTVAPGYFVPSDLPLLVQYVEALALAERAVRQLRRAPVKGNRVSPWLAIAEKCWRATATLATKLRLAPQSRYDARAAGRSGHGEPASIYDHMRAIND